METSAKTAMNVNDIFLAIGMVFFCNFLSIYKCGKPSNRFSVVFFLNFAK
jgi:hypothetical protein